MGIDAGRARTELGRVGAYSAGLAGRQQYSGRLARAFEVGHQTHGLRGRSGRCTNALWKGPAGDSWWTVVGTAIGFVGLDLTAGATGQFAAGGTGARPHWSALRQHPPVNARRGTAEEPRRIGQRLGKARSSVSPHPAELFEPKPALDGLLTENSFLGRCRPATHPVFDARWGTRFRSGRTWGRALAVSGPAVAG